MLVDRVQEVLRSPVVQEEEPLADSPQRRATEFVGSGVALGDAVGEAGSHVVHGQIGKQVHGLLVESADRGKTGLQRRGMAHRATYRVEVAQAVGDGARRNAAI